MYTELIEKMQPKPIFNLDFYKGEDLYCEGEIEDIMINLIAGSKPEDYSKVVYDNFNWSTFYHLTHIRKNILNWYPFDPEGNVLEIGCGLGAITNMLCEKCKSVKAVELSKKRATAALLRCRQQENLEIIVGNLNDIEFEEKFDYITLIGVLEYQVNYTDTDNPFVNFLSTIRKLLKPDGKLLIAIENKYGLKYWCGAPEDHTGVPFDGMNQYAVGSKIARTFSKKELDNIIKDSGFRNTFFYYPLPDYKLPTVIYSEKYLPQAENLMNMLPYYTTNATLVAGESSIYRDLIDNNVFEFFANSFLVECSDGEKIGEVKFASISADRQPQYRVLTRLRDNIAEKLPFDSNVGAEHIKQTFKNQELLKARGIKIWDYRLKGDILESDLCTKYRLVEDVIIQCYKNGDIEGIYEIFDRVYSDILASSEQVEPSLNIMYDFGVPRDSGRDYGPVLKLGFLDMIFRNAFYDGKDNYWFDQEWLLENVPAKLILFTAVSEFYYSFQWCDGVLSKQDVLSHYQMDDIANEFFDFRSKFFGAVVDNEFCAERNAFCQNAGGMIINNIKKLLDN